MKPEMNNELPPFEIKEQKDLEEIGMALIDNPGMIQPIVFIFPEGVPAGEFFISIIEEEDTEYVQYEGFSNAAMIMIFKMAYEGIYSTVQDGIYRVKLKQPPVANH